MISVLRNTLFILLFISGITPVYADNNSVEKQFNKIKQVLNVLDRHYLDSVDLPFLTKQAIISVLKELDPHSKYVTKEQLKRTGERMKGSFGGVGIRFYIQRDTLYVVSLFPDGPSEKAGLLQGDRIVKVNDSIIAGTSLKNSDVLKLLKGKINTQVKVSVKRKHRQELLDLTINRGKIPIHSVDASYMIDDEIGYIKISRFTGTTKTEFENALKKLISQGMMKLVLDLKGNPGGYLRAAFSITGQFLGKDKMVVYIQGLHRPKIEYITKKDGLFEKGDLAILVDRHSASASEIVAGAIQDWDRGIIIGRRTYGKGLVQRQFKLNDGSAIKITTSKYFTPCGRNIQKPFDIDDKTYYSDISSRFKAGELVHPDSIQVDESLRFKTLLTKRTVFGGGGIIPDRFIPLDTSSNYAYYNQLLRKNILFKLMLDYIDRHKEEIMEKYPTFEAFNTGFELPVSMFLEISKSAIINGINSDSSDTDKVKHQIQKYIKSNIARILWSNSAYFRLQNQDSKELLSAVKLLREEKMYEEAIK